MWFLPIFPLQASGFYNNKEMLDLVVDIDESHPKELYNLGYRFETSLGVKEDLIKARKYYEEAAGLGDIRAVFRLGFISEKGRGVQQD